jgi:hypothetical protein
MAQSPGFGITTCTKLWRFPQQFVTLFITAHPTVP